MKVNPVVHFEMPAEDRKHMADFYTRTVGWQANQLGEEMGNYIVVMTSECDGTGLPKERGQINGGFLKCSASRGIYQESDSMFHFPRMENLKK